jgi:hypothetical protein
VKMTVNRTIRTGSASLHKSEALVTAAIAVESNPTTMDPRIDQAAAGVVSIFNVGKQLKSYSP